MSEKIPQQALEGCKPEIDYPCVWQYKVIGMEQKAVQAALSEQLGDAPYSLSESRTSRKGKYISLNLELTVHNEEQRLQLYSSLTAHPSIKLVPMNQAVQNALEEASPALDSKIIPVMREAITTVQIVLFQQLKESVSRRYPQYAEEERIRLTGAVVNNLYGTEALDPQVNHFARDHRELIEEELRGLRTQVPELIPHITDSLRMQTLCDNHEGVHSIPCLLLARELGLLEENRELPLPSTFMLSVRKLGATSGLVKPLQTNPPSAGQETKQGE